MLQLDKLIMKLTDNNLLVNSTLMWSPTRTAIPRMRKGSPTHLTRPLSIDQRAEDGGASSLSNDIDCRITRSDAIAVPKLIRSS